MEYRITLKRLKPYKAGFILGISIIIYVLIRLIFDKEEDDAIWTFLYALFYIPFSIIFLLDSYGYPFGRGTIEINNDIISMGSGMWFKRQTVVWDEISEIAFQKKRLHFKLKNNKLTDIHTTRVPDTQLKLIKQTLINIAETKNITINNLEEKK
jgi:hypothetical protein